MPGFLRYFEWFTSDHTKELNSLAKNIKSEIDGEITDIKEGNTEVEIDRTLENLAIATEHNNSHTAEKKPDNDKTTKNDTTIDKLNKKFNREQYPGIDDESWKKFYNGLNQAGFLGITEFILKKNLLDKGYPYSYFDSQHKVYIEGDSIKLETTLEARYVDTSMGENNINDIKYRNNKNLINKDFPVLTTYKTTFIFSGKGDVTSKLDIEEKKLTNKAHKRMQKALRQITKPSIAQSIGDFIRRIFGFGKSKTPDSDSKPRSKSKSKL